MKIYFDASTDSISEWEHEHNWEFGQFRTPLTQYAKGAYPWVLDNGCFSRFEPEKFKRMWEDAIVDDSCHWVVVPDVVGDADETLHRFIKYTDIFPDILSKAAYVAQDGQHSVLVPWEDIVCLFIGGTDAYKDSVEAYKLALEAKRRGKWVHVGRCNGITRAIQWFAVADSIDGSGISRFTNHRNRFVQDLKALHQYNQSTLDDWA